MKNLQILKKIFLFSIFILIFNKPASADDKVSHPEIEPLPSELLTKTIKLQCPGMEVDEWRPDSHYPQFTSKTNEGIEAINKYCKLALEKYPLFLKERDLKFSISPIVVKISLISANIYLDGKKPRNLNDANGRMYFLTPEHYIWGNWNSPHNRMFVRNDPVYFVNKKAIPNKYWQRTFLHEMVHVLNEYYHVIPWNTITLTQDEEMAEEFVTWLGYNFRNDSSSEDLDMKKIFSADDSKLRASF